MIEVIKDFSIIDTLGDCVELKSGTNLIPYAIELEHIMHRGNRRILIRVSFEYEGHYFFIPREKKKFLKIRNSRKDLEGKTLNIYVDRNYKGTEVVHRGKIRLSSRIYPL